MALGDDDEESLVDVGELVTVGPLLGTELGTALGSDEEESAVDVGELVTVGTLLGI